MKNLPVEPGFLEKLYRQVGAQVPELLQQERPNDMEALFHYFINVGDMVTGMIRPVLEKEYPQIRWLEIDELAEEQQIGDLTGDYWVFDPIDGTHQLAADVSTWSMTLALIRDGQPIYAQVYAPALNEFFSAIAGEGAFLNGKRICASSKDAFSYAYLATAMPSQPKKHPEATERSLRLLSRILPRVLGIRMLGSIALQLAYVAAGRFDGYWEFGNDVADWLAGALLAREAGAIVTDIQGHELSWQASGIIVGNASVHRELREEVASVV